MKVVGAEAGSGAMLTGDIAGSARHPGELRHGILFAPAMAENLSRLVLEHAANIPAFGPRRFPKRQMTEARTS